jgi:hypothetical protein
MKDSTMKKIFNCRRSIVSIFAIACLTLLGMYHGVDVSGIALAIAGIAGSLSGANAWENRGKAPEVVPAASTDPKPDSPD